MLGGGINNIDIINASQSEARNKLRRMAGIKDSPSGILASSPELMQAVAGAAPAMPVRATGPATPMTPAPVPMVQAALPQVPMQTTVAPGPVQQPVQQTPAPRPTAPAPQPQQPPVMMNEGGFLTRAKDAINAIPGKMAEAGMFRNIDKPQPVDITQDPIAFLNRIDQETGGAVTEKYGSTEAALEEGRKKANTLEAATEATKDPKKLTDTVMVLAEVEPTDENKKDFATNVLGLQDVNDIDEINNRIAEVALYSSIGGGTTGTDKLAKALMLGLNNYKQTASARAAGAGGGVKSRDYRNAKDAYQDAFTKAMGVSDVDIPEGMTKEEYATQFAETVVRRTYTPQQIAAAGVTMGSLPSGGGKSGPTLEEFLVEAQKINPDSSVEELTEFYNKRYGG